MRTALAARFAEAVPPNINIAMRGALSEEERRKLAFVEQAFSGEFKFCKDVQLDPELKRAVEWSISRSPAEARATRENIVQSIEAGGRGLARPPCECAIVVADSRVADLWESGAVEAWMQHADAETRPSLRYSRDHLWLYSPARFAGK